MYLQSKITKTNKAKWNRIKRKILSASGKVVQVGVFGDRYGPENNNLPVATVFRTQEYGDPGKRIPPRPAIREGLVQEMRMGLTKDAKMARYLLNKSLSDSLKGKTIASGNKSLKEAGSVLEGILKRVITDWSRPPNSSYTQRLKGGRNDPLVDTGRMRDSVKYRVRRR